jgi:tetratricopeptide (TPR) repeat protein
MSRKSKKRSSKKKNRARIAQTAPIKPSNSGAEAATSEVQSAPPKQKQFWERKSVFLLSLLLVAICFSTYYNSLSGDFVWDDRALILKDKMIKDLSNIPQAFNRDFFDFTDEEPFKYGYFRPVITISYMIDYAIWGENSYGFHLTNLLVHTICSIFVFWIFLALTHVRRLALLGGVLFAVHPIHTESVSWISGRTDLFCCIFLLAALGCYMAYRTERDSIGFLKTIPPNLLYGWSLFFFSLSLLSKEMGVVLIPMIVVLEWFHICKREGKTFSWKNTITKVLPYLVLTVGYLILHTMVVKRLSSNILKIDLANIYPNIITFFKGFCLYLFKLLLPVHLSAYLKVDLLTKLTHPDTMFYFFIFIIFFYVISIASEQRPLLGLGGGMLLVAMLPLSNIVRITSPQDMGFTMAERFMYIPSIGFFLVFVIVLDWAKEKIRYPSMRWLTTALIIALIGALGLRAVLRNRDWQNDETLFIAEAETTAESTLIHSNLGRFYARNGQLNKAVYHLKQALEMAPDSPALMNNLGRVLIDMENFAEAAVYLEKAISLNPIRFQFYNNYGLAMAGLVYYQKAIEAYITALELRPTSSQAYNNLGVTYKNFGDFEKAEFCYLKAIEHDEKYAPPHKNLAILYMNHMNKPDLVAGALQRSLEIDPKQPDAVLMRSLILSYEFTASPPK